MLGRRVKLILHNIKFEQLNLYHYLYKNDLLFTVFGIGKRNVNFNSIIIVRLCLLLYLIYNIFITKFHFFFSRDLLKFLFLFFQGQLIENHGHPSYGRYSIPTEDGYLITLFHIEDNNGPPFLLLHALMGASDQWFLRDQQHDLRKCYRNDLKCCYDVRKSSKNKQIF